MRLSHIRYNGVLLWNVNVDWSTVGTWFGICSALGARMQARGLVYLLFVAQIMWLGLFDVCNAEGEWVEQSVRGHEICVGGL